MNDYQNLFPDEERTREMAEYIVHVLKVTTVGQASTFLSRL